MIYKFKKPHNHFLLYEEINQRFPGTDLMSSGDDFEVHMKQKLPGNDDLILESIVNAHNASGLSSKDREDAFINNARTQLLGEIDAGQNPVSSVAEASLRINRLERLVLNLARVLRLKND